MDRLQRSRSTGAGRTSKPYTPRNKDLHSLILESPMLEPKHWVMSKPRLRLDSMWPLTFKTCAPAPPVLVCHFYVDSAAGFAGMTRGCPALSTLGPAPAGTNCLHAGCKRRSLDCSRRRGCVTMATAFLPNSQSAFARARRSGTLLTTRLTCPDLALRHGGLDHILHDDD